MGTDFIYMPRTEHVEAQITIADLIPFGSENAISRQTLVAEAIANGLVEENGDSDRTTRKLIQNARIDYTILNRPNGGYYRPTHEDLLELCKYIRQEEKRATSIFRSIKKAKALYEDYKRGLEVEGN